MKRCTKRANLKGPNTQLHTLKTIVFFESRQRVGKTDETQKETKKQISFIHSFQLAALCQTKMAAKTFNTVTRGCFVCLWSFLVTFFSQICFVSHGAPSVSKTSFSLSIISYMARLQHFFFRFHVLCNTCTTSNKKLLGAPGRTSRSRDVTRGALLFFCLLGSKDLAFRP